MILKYIEASVSNNKKHYDFIKVDIEFDKTKNSIILPKEYIEEDIKNHLKFIDCLYYDELINRKLYSSINSIKRAIKNNCIQVDLSIAYCSDISKSDIMYLSFANEVRSLNHVARYCTAVEYNYNLNTDKITRYEVYGDLVLGDRFEREELYYDKYISPKELDFLNERLK